MKFYKIGVATSFGLFWMSDKEMADAGLRWGKRRQYIAFPRKNDAILSDFCELYAWDMFIEDPDKVLKTGEFA